MSFPLYDVPSNWLALVLDYHAHAYGTPDIPDIYNYVGDISGNTEIEYDAIIWDDARSQPSYATLSDPSFQQEAISTMAGYFSTFNQLSDHAQIATDATSITVLSTSLTDAVSTSTTINTHALSGNIVLTADDIGDGTTNKAYSATDKTKLAGIASGATANSADATLLNRANHTGTQSADTIVDGTTNKVLSAANLTKLNGIASGATAQVNSDWSASSGAAQILNKPSLMTVYNGTTLVSNPKVFIGSATVASGVAVFQLTADGTSTGAALFPNGPIQSSLNYWVNDATASYQVGAVWSNSNKTLTLTANKLGTANILTGLLGQLAANGAVVNVTVLGS